MDTEALAFSAVKSAIAKTDYLVDYIKDKIKLNLWCVDEKVVKIIQLFYKK